VTSFFHWLQSLATLFAPFYMSLIACRSFLKVESESGPTHKHKQVYTTEGKYKIRNHILVTSYIYLLGHQREGAWEGCSQFNGAVTVMWTRHTLSIHTKWSHFNKCVRHVEYIYPSVKIANSHTHQCVTEYKVSFHNKSEIYVLVDGYKIRQWWTVTVLSKCWATH